MTGRLSHDRRRLIHRYMDDTVVGDPAADEFEADLAEPDELDELELPFSEPEPLVRPGPLRRAWWRVGVGLRRHPQIGWVLAGAVFALAVGYLVAHHG